MSAVLLAVVVWAAHYGYYRFPSLDDRPWAQYVGTHLALAVVLLMQSRRAGQASNVALSMLGMGACYLGAIESAQCVVCGLHEWGHPVEQDLCLQAFGAAPYAIVAALLGASLAVRLLGGRHG